MPLVLGCSGRGGGGDGGGRRGPGAAAAHGSWVPAPAVGALQGEALGLSRRHRAGRAAQVGAVGSSGMPRRIGVLAVIVSCRGVTSLVHAPRRQRAL